MNKTVFNNKKGKEFEDKETIKNANLPLEWKWDKGNCPHCGKNISVTKNYTIDEVHVYEASDGDILFLGYTKEILGGRPLTLQLPDAEFYSEKDMTAAITAKSKYLKEKL